LLNVKHVVASRNQ